MGEEEVGGFVEEVFLSMSRLTGTNLQYHLLGDLMVDDDRTTTGENVRCFPKQQQGKICYSC